MRRPAIAIVSDDIGGVSSIGAIAAWDAYEALRRGWEVVAICQRLDPGLRGAVTHVSLPVPPGPHLVKYAGGRGAVRRALRGHELDVVMTHQPQSAAIADVWNVHFIERAARQVRGSLAAGWRPRVVDLTHAAVARIEDSLVSNLPASTRVLFCSEPVRDDFIRLYGAPRNYTVVPNAAPHEPDPIALPDVGRRLALVGAHSGPVAGFLGGDDRRKGIDLLRESVAGESELFAVIAGAEASARPQERTTEMGMLTDVRQLLDIVDALVVPSRFDPFPLVVLEAASRGVPVIVSAAVGSAPLVIEHGAGLLWDGRSALAPLVHEVTVNRARYGAGGVELARSLSTDRLARWRFEEFEAAAESGDRRRGRGELVGDR